MKEYTSKELLEIIDSGKLGQEHINSILHHEIAYRKKRNHDGSFVSLSLCELHDRYFVIQRSILYTEGTVSGIHKSITEVSLPDDSLTKVSVEHFTVTAIKDGELFEFI